MGKLEVGGVSGGRGGGGARRRCRRVGDRLDGVEGAGRESGVEENADGGVEELRALQGVNSAAVEGDCGDVFLLPPESYDRLQTK